MYIVYAAGYYRKFGRVTEFLIASLCFTRITHTLFCIDKMYFLRIFSWKFHEYLVKWQSLTISMYKFCRWIYKSACIHFIRILGTHWRNQLQIIIKWEFRKSFLSFIWIFDEFSDNKPKNFIQNKWKTFKNFE